MRELILSRQGKTMQQATDFELIEEALIALDGVNDSRISISDAEGGYIRILGRQDLLAICLGQNMETKLKHFVLGLSKREEQEVPLNFGKLLVHVQKNELMGIEDALLITRCYFEEKAFPAAYNLREIEKPFF